MQISISEQEFEAICFAMDQVSTALQGSSDESYISDAERALNALYDVKVKYRRSRSKNESIKAIKREYLKYKPGTPDRIALKQARKMLRLAGENKWQESIDLTK